VGRAARIALVSTFGDGATLDVPGSPRVIALPGHTPGSAALHVPSHDALFVGDAMATYAVTTGRTGPMIAPFSADPAEAVASLARLDGMEAGLVLPGHGDAWTGGVAEAVRLIREGAASTAR
jgi:glyoxylase-like metal-dependent hydrolase (beta-lactamase superfamily II)